MESSLQKLVESESNGKLDFRVKKVRLHIFDLRFDLKESEIQTIDSTNAESGYRVKIDRLSVEMHSLVSVFKRNLLIIDSIIIKSPIVEVIKYKDSEQGKTSLPDEMGKVYKSLEQGLAVVNLNYLRIANAKFIIDNRVNPETKPLTISNLNLTIENISKESKIKKDRFLFADRILLEVFNQDILFPDGIHGVKFKRLQLSTRSQTVKLDSCYIYGKSVDLLTEEFSVYLDSIRIKNLDFNSLVKENVLKFDTALCINPDINFNLQIKNKGNSAANVNQSSSSGESIHDNLKRVLGNLNLGYVAVENADINIVTEINNKVSTYQSRNSNFSIEELLTSNKDTLPIYVGKINLNIHDYMGYSPDSMYVIRFDDISLINKKILLNNFSVAPVKANHKLLRRAIKMEAFEIDDIDWMTLLSEKRIVAGHASLIKPDVHIVLSGVGKKEPGKTKTNPFTILNEMRDKVQIQNIYVENGNLKFDAANGTKLSMENFFLGVNVNNLLASDDITVAIEAIDTFSFSRGYFSGAGRQFSIYSTNYSKENSNLFFKQITQARSERSQTILLKNLKLDGIKLNSLSDISLDKISWGSASVAMKLNQEKTQEKTKPRGDFKFTLKKLSGGPTQVNITSQNIEASTVLNSISTNEILIQSGKKPQIGELFIDGQSIMLEQQKKIHGSMNNFKVIENKPSVLNNVQIKLPVNGEIASVFVPKLTFSLDINSCLNGDIKGEFIELSNPSVTFSKSESEPETTENRKPRSGGFPVVNIKKITIDQPEIQALPAELAQKMQFNPGQSKIILNGVHSDSTHLKVDNVSVSVIQPVFQTGKFRLNSTGSEKIEVAASAINYQPATPQTKSSWSFNLDRANFENINLSTLQNDTIKQTVDLKNLTVKGLQFKDSFALKQENIANFSIQNGNIKLTNDKINLAVYNLGFTAAAKNIDIDSLKFSPVPDRDSFMKTKEFQSTYIQIYTGKINIKGLDNGQLLKDSVLRLSTIRVNDLRFLAYKDKRLPFLHTEKPMLTKLLLDVNQKIHIDSVIVRNGFIGYEEFNDKTEQNGKIDFTKIRGVISNIKTFNTQQFDTLAASFYTKFLDTAVVRLSVNQSYYDSLSGGHLKIIVSPFDLTALNPILRTFASAELKSGKLDTLRLSVIGRKYVAFGVMKMYYEDLNLVYLKKGDTENKTWLSKTISFLANRVVKTKNKKGTHEVYAERDIEKRFVNYWVKIIISGVLSNTGIRSDRKQVKKYEKGLKKRDVPPIPDIPVDF